MKLKLNDTVKATLGKDRGKTGKIEKVLPRQNAVIVTGLNLYKKHLKAQGENKPGGIIDIAKPLNAAKVALICPHCKKPTRVGYQLGKTKQTKVRICRQCQKPIDSGSSQKK